LAAIYGIVGFAFPLLQAEVWKVAWRVELLRRPERVAASSLGSARFERLEAVELKGFSAPVPVFALRAVVLEERTA
jgi:class 3 adenylate cyclase